MALVLSMRNALRDLLMRVHILYLRRVWHHDLDESARISFGAYLDKTNPRGIKIGAQTIVTRGAMVLSHDFCRATRSDTIIGQRCFIGVGAIVMPGVRIGDEVVVGAGSVVTKDVARGQLVAGNPAKVLKSIRTRAYGQIEEVIDEPGGSPRRFGG